MLHNVNVLFKHVLRNGCLLTFIIGQFIMMADQIEEIG